MTDWTIDKIIVKPRLALDTIEAQKRRIDDLLEANNRYLERARFAEGQRDALEGVTVPILKTRLKAAEARQLEPEPRMVVFPADELPGLLRAERICRLWSADPKHIPGAIASTLHDLRVKRSRAALAAEGQGHNLKAQAKADRPIKRYDFEPSWAGNFLAVNAIEKPDGKWVKYEDIEKAGQGETNG